MKDYLDQLKELKEIDKEFNIVLNKVMQRGDIAKEAIRITIDSFKKLIKELKELMK